MPEYISMVKIDGSEKRYLVDRSSYFLLCDLQKSKPTRKVLETILEWLSNNGKAIILEYNPHFLWFSKESKNMTTDEDMDC